MKRWPPGPVVLVAAVLVVLHAGCDRRPAPPPDDAKRAGLTPADFPQVVDDVFRQMDGGIQLDAHEVKGRNTWLLWSAGNPVFWDRVARESAGLVDLLKTLDSRLRARRFARMGLVNEPGFRMAAAPDTHGLWLDERVEPAPAGINERTYGRSSGVIGFRIYPNPDFDGAARAAWDPDRYYRDRSYFEDPRLVRPYRVGVTCALCHVAPHPLHPPADPEQPRWENLASAVGNQYFREGKVFALDLRPDAFLGQMLDAQPPGTSDTSRVATDHINNPGAINAIFSLEARLGLAAGERLDRPARALPGGAPRRVPHILKDGADSVGVAGAVMRVYVNEGLYAQQWLTDHDPLLGFRRQRPFRIAEASRQSVYWQATAERVDDVARFFARLTPFHLEDAPGGRAYLTDSPATLERGKRLFAELCAACHSSKQPPTGVEPGSADAADWYRDSVQRPDFRSDNFLSTDRRYPVTRIKTNACRALATNATRGHVWDNFSSQTYKTLDAVGTIETWNPADPARPYRFKAPGGGPGYYRAPSLVSIWSSAPFLHNNSVGTYTGDPSVAGRMRAFDDAIEKLLWPERRDGPRSIAVTDRPTYIRIPEAKVPEALRPLCRDGRLEIGPIPAGIPIDLVANVDPSPANLLRLIPVVRAAFSGTGGSPAKLVAALMAASTCPDLIRDRGHLFGTGLTESNKQALIAFLKTL